jgi:WD40 repeat protein/serine/threonine protein kinase
MGITSWNASNLLITIDGPVATLKRHRIVCVAPSPRYTRSIPKSPPTASLNGPLMSVEVATPPPGDSSTGTVAGLVEALVKHRLLEPTQADELAQLQTRYTDPKLLARELISRGWLTPYQVNQIFLGRAAQLVLGSYVLLERLGEGGMGQVFKARHQNLGRLAALKLIRRDRLANDEVVQRFHREVQAVAKLSHPNVVVAFDADEAGGTHYFAMEYVEGTDLGKRIKTSGPLPVDQACDFIRQAALGLQHAHERGMIHRDIKPSNLLLTKKGDAVKVLDLGLARLVRSQEGSNSGNTLTNQGMLMGTPDFIAPEQARNSHNIDARADLYSLGCTLYFLLTGQAPFAADTATEKLYKHWFEEAQPLEQLRPEIPPAVALIVRRLMAKRPDDRFPSAATLVEALTPPIGANGFVLEPPPVVAVQALPALVPTPRVFPVGSTTETDVPVAVPVTAPTGSPFITPPHQRRPYGLLAGVVGGIAMLTLFIILLARSGSGGPVSGRAGTTETTPARSREQQAEADLLTLTGRCNDPNTDEETLRRDLQAFRARYYDLPVLTTQAGEQLARLRWPLDDAQRRLFARPDAYDAVPKQVIGILGDPHWRHWGGGSLVTFSPDGQSIASAGSDGIRVWHARTGRELALLDPGFTPQALRFADKGKTLLVAGPRGRLAKFDWASDDRARSVVEGPAGTFVSRAISADGTLVAGALENGTILLSTIGSDDKPLSLAGHKGKVHSLAFSTNGKALVSGGDDKIVRVWDVASGMETARLEDHEQAIRAVALSADGQTAASGGDDEDIRVWDVASGKRRTSLEVRHRRGVTALLFLGGARNLAAGGTDGIVQIWHVPSGEERTYWLAHPSWIAALAHHGDSQRLASIGPDGTVRVFNLETEQPLDDLRAPAGMLAATAFAPNGATLATAGVDRTVRLWDLQRGHERFPALRKHDATVNCLCFSADGKSLASGGSDSFVWLWDPATGKAREAATGPRGSVLSVALSLDGKTLAFGCWYNDERTNASEAGIWDMAGHRLRSTIKGYRHGVTGMAISPDGMTIVSTSWDGSLRVSEWQTGTERFAIPTAAAAECVAYAPTGNAVAVGDREGKVKLWDLASRSVIRPLAGHRTHVTALAFSPDGKWLATASGDGTVILWGWTTGARLETYKLPGTVYGLSFAPDCRHVATANANGTAYLLRLAAHQPR